jgi:hypothetical protein
MVARRAFAGAAAQTTITAGINSSALTITIASSTGWPSGAEFYCVIDPGLANEEKVLVTRTGNTLSCASTAKRGVDGTTAQSHDAGAVIYPCVAAADLDEANALTSLMTTRGDLIVRGAAVAERLPKGSAGLPLVAGANDPAYTQLGTGGIANNAVTADKIAANAVVESKIADGAVTTGKLAGSAVTFDKMLDVAACSVIGRSANTTGQPAAITAGSNDVVLRRESNTVNFGKVTPLMLGEARGGAWRRVAAVNVNSGTSSTITPDTTDLGYAGVSLSGSTFTINSGYGGWWTLTLMVTWSASAGNNGYVQINAEGWQYRAECTTSNVSSHATVTAVVPMSPGGTFQFSVFQNSGSTINYGAKMHALYSGPLA